MKTMFEKLTKSVGAMMIIISLAMMMIVNMASAQVIYDLRNGLSYTTVLSPRNSAAADTSYAIDVSPYIGKVVFVQTITGAGGTTITYAAKIQHSTDSTTWAGATSDSSFTDFVSASRTLTGSIAYKALDIRKVKRYLRYITTISASDTSQAGVVMIGLPRNR